MIQETPILYQISSYTETVEIKRVENVLINIIGIPSLTSTTLSPCPTVEDGGKARP